MNERMNECYFYLFIFFMYLNVLISTISYIVDRFGTGELRLMFWGGVLGGGHESFYSSRSWLCSIENKLGFG